eukprot:SAG11_NODE_6910_length_1227_cov_3.105496_2_plen_186_part_01
MGHGAWISPAATARVAKRRQSGDNWERTLSAASKMVAASRHCSAFPWPSIAVSPPTAPAFTTSIAYCSRRSNQFYSGWYLTYKTKHSDPKYTFVAGRHLQSGSRTTSTSERSSGGSGGCGGSSGSGGGGANLRVVLEQACEPIGGGRPAAAEPERAAPTREGCAAELGRLLQQPRVCVPQHRRRVA